MRWILFPILSLLLVASIGCGPSAEHTRLIQQQQDQIEKLQVELAIARAEISALRSQAPQVVVKEVESPKCVERVKESPVAVPVVVEVPVCCRVCVTHPPCPCPPIRPIPPAPPPPPCPPKPPPSHPPAPSALSTPPSPPTPPTPPSSHPPKLPTPLAMQPRPGVLSKPPVLPKIDHADAASKPVVSLLAATLSQARPNQAFSRYMRSPMASPLPKNITEYHR